MLIWLLTFLSFVGQAARGSKGYDDPNKRGNGSMLLVSDHS